MTTGATATQPTHEALASMTKLTKDLKSVIGGVFAPITCS